jgi:hypothetical protein
MKYKICQRGVIALVVLLASAGRGYGTNSVEEFDAYIKDPNAQRIAVQVCMPKRTTYFDEVIVDVADMPANLPLSEVQRMFKEAKTMQRYENPYRSLNGKSEMVTIRHWRGPQAASDYPKPWINISDIAQVKTVLSAGGNTTKLVDSTSSNQPVFFAFIGDRLSDLVMIYVKVPINDAEPTRFVTYWYQLPRTVGALRYTDWVAAISEEQQEKMGRKPSAWVYLTQGRGKEMPIYAVGDDAPKIRFTSMTISENSRLDENLRRARYTLQLKSLTKGINIDDDGHYYVPAKRGEIPPC